MGSGLVGAPTSNSLSQSANAVLGIALPLMYGYCRVRGDNILLQELANKTRVAFYILGEGEWDGIETLWINKKLVNQADTTLVHFHPGVDGTLGHGLAIESNGGDQLVDNFFSSIPANFQPLTYSRKAYIAVSVPPDPGAPDANLDVVGDYRCSKVRIFDASGNQTGYQFSTNGAWQMLDVILRKMLKPEWNPSAAAAAGGDLTAAEKARINFPAVVAAAAWCDTIIATGQKRFESSVAFVTTIKMQQALTQLCTMSQLYVTEDGGQIYIMPDQPRASTFTLTADHVVAGKTAFDKIDLHGSANRIIASFNDLHPLDQADIDTVGNSGLVRLSNTVTVQTTTPHGFIFLDRGQIVPPTDGSAHDSSFDGPFQVFSVPDSTHFTFGQPGADATSGNGYVGTIESRFVQRTTIGDHERHQNAIGARGLNLNAVFRKLPLNLSLGNNTMERVQRILNFLKTRNLGVDAVPYNAPWTGKITAYLDAVDANNRALIAQLMGDIITVDATVSEEFQGDYEIVESTINIPAHDGTGSGSSSASSQNADEPTIDLKLLQYIPGAFSDVSIVAQSVRASISRKGLAPITAVDSNGVQRLAGTFKNNPVNCVGSFIGGNPLTQSSTSTTVLIASFTMQWGDGQVSYNSGSVNSGAYQGQYVTFDDPSFAGGSVIYSFTTTKSNQVGANGRGSCGKITTNAGGGAFGQGGGGGGCFSGNTMVRLARGTVPFDAIQQCAMVVLENGEIRMAVKRSRKYSGWMHEMGNGELVTPGHLIRVSEKFYGPARDVWSERVRFEGDVHTLEVSTDDDTERHFILGNGRIAHNISPDLI